MNTITMKLENKHSILPSSKIKGKDSVVGKKSKNLRKKSIAANTDKDASLIDHGLGRKSSEINYDFNDSKSSNPMEQSSSKKSRCKKNCTKSNDKTITTSKTMHERLQQILSPSAKDKISSILNEVKSLSDVEKLFLYLQLPTGSPFEVDPFKIRNQNPLGKKADDEGMIAVTWIQSHLEEDPEVSLPKQEVYDEYQSYCHMTGTDALCAADFGKVMKQIFPSVKPRRLGTRGNSRYCYSGLRKKLNLKPPSLPDINTDPESCDAPAENIKDEVTSASCHILFEWAEKLLGFKFTSLKELASHLLENMYVDNRSVAAFTVLLEGSPQLLEKGFSNCEGGIKKSEAQVHLQRKIQEKELIKEQKKKLQEQRSNFTSASKGKVSVPKKKNAKSRKSKVLSEKSDISSEKEIDLILSQSIKENSLTSSSESSSMQVDKNLIEKVIKEEDMDLELIVDMEQVVNDTPTSSNSNTQSSPSKPSEPCSENVLKLEDTSTKNTKIIIPRSKTPVCISQSLPGIIIVPSLPQIAEIGKQVSPKYKKIQPKPLKGDALSAMARSRAGSLGSTSINKPKSKTNDGRHSSHAWLQSSSSPEGNDFFVKSNTSNTRTVLLSSTQKTLKKNCFIVPKEKTSDKLKEDLRFSLENQSSSAFKDVKLQANSDPNEVSIESSGGSILKSNPLRKSSLPSKESNALKRPLDESRSNLKSKKLLLDANAMESSYQDLPSSVKVQNVPSRRLSVQQNAAAEEVSIHEIEGDALNDYYRGNNCQTLLPSSMLVVEDKDSKKEKQDFNKNISQLRMLLEQKISCSQSNPLLLNSLKDISKSDLSLHLNQKETLFYSSDVNLGEGKLTTEQEQSDKVNLNLCSLSFEEEKQIKNISQLETIEKFLDSHLASQDQVNGPNAYISDANIYLTNPKTNFQQIDMDLPDFQQNLINSNSDLLTSDLMDNLEYGTPQINNTALPVRVNTYTQVPSVPQSPNTRRRAFNFMPISPSHTPIPDMSGSVSSPIPNQFPRNMMSIGVGPSQPPSNAGSPFVSPRSTPVSTCRSRHSSGQSTSRHTPFQNFDSGVSSVSSSPFISPQPTPVSRLRHNSSHSSNKTVTFCSVNSPHIINSLSTSSRSRHNSGPGVQHLSGNLNARTNPLSPLVAEPQPSFIFPPGNELRYRHNSDSNTTSLSPVSEQTSSSSSCTSNLPDLTSVNDLALSQSFLNDSAADLLISGNSSNFKQVRQRHASSSVIYSKSYVAAKDPFSPEIQNLLKNEQISGATNNQLSNRSQSVPLHQMLQNLNNFYFLNAPIDEVSTKSHPTTPVLNQAFSFPLLNSNQENALLSAELLNSDKSFSQNWSGLENTGDLEVSNARRNLAGLLDPPLSDDLQTTLEDLRDCDNDFSKFAQELELNPNEDGNL